MPENNDTRSTSEKRHQALEAQMKQRQFVQRLKERGERAGIRKQLETIEDDKEFKRAKLGHRETQKEEKADREKKAVRREQNAGVKRA